MILRWIHKTWTWFWFTVIAVISTAALLLLTGWGLLQFGPVQNYVADNIEYRFNNTFEGTLRIGSLGGVLPLNIILKDISVTHSGPESEPDTVIAASSLRGQIDFRSLLRGSLRINTIEIDEPEIRITIVESGMSGFQKAFRLNEPDTLNENRVEHSVSLPVFYLNNLILNRGTVEIIGLQTGDDTISLPESFTLTNIDLNLAMESARDFKFLNVHNLSFISPDFKAGSVNARGQLFADDRFFELNAIRVITPQSNILFNLNFEDVDIFSPDLIEQIKNSKIRADVQFRQFLPSEFDDLFPLLADYQTQFEAEVNLAGTRTETEISRFNLALGDSRVQLNGSVKNLLNDREREFFVDLEYLNVKYDDLIAANVPVEQIAFKDWDEITFRGLINGNMREVNSQIIVAPPHGEAEINAGFKFDEPVNYIFELTASDILFSDFPSLNQPESRFSGKLLLTGTGMDYKTADAKLQLHVQNSRFDILDLEQAEITATLNDGFIEPEIKISNGSGSASINGWIDLMGNEIVSQLSGEFTQFNLASFFHLDNVQESELNAVFNTRLHGFAVDELYGDLFIGLNESTYKGIPVEAHELIVILDSYELEQRTLRIDGSLMEAEITGNLIPTRLAGSIDYWIDEVAELVRRRTVFTDFELSEMLKTVRVDKKNVGIDMNVRLQIDDLSLLHVFFSEFPEINTLTNLNLDIKTDRETIRLEGSLLSDYINYDLVSTDSLSLHFSAELHNNRVYDFFSTTISSQFRSLTAAGIEFENADILIDGYDEAFVLQQFSAYTGDNVEIGLMLSSVFSVYDVDIRIMEFFVGDEDYSWSNISDTPVVIDRDGRIVIEKLEFANRDERILIDGIFSEQPTDSVSYTFSNFGLQTISDLSGADVSFNGIMNGVFITRTLRTEPAFQGSLDIDGIEIDGRILGDLSFSSIFVPESERFEVDMRIFTDPKYYSEYLDDADNVGTNIDISGYLSTPAGRTEGEPVSAFQIDFKELDLWILPYFVSGIFDEIYGKTTGTGLLEIYDDDFRYDASFQLNDVTAVPVFLNTRLLLNGSIDLNNENGVVLNDVDVSDGRGGTGRLFGSIIVGDFASEMPMDISLSMNRLTFLNNSYQEDIPFHGQIAGTGTVNLGGTDRHPFISTSEPITITPNSNISIPAGTDSYVDERARFIEFVDSFDYIYSPRAQDGEQPQEDRPELTFMEQFQFDLQFIANDNMNVRLVFDPITSDVLNARGTGRIRLTLEDEELRVFGRFDVSGGDYNFVGGDIIARRFNIRDGGSIIWEGDPVNARLDVTATYRARPDITALRPEIGDDTSVRVPVELILVITGTLESIENDFFFEFPSGVDAGQTASYLALLNSEDQKLVQATSLLFTGNFIPIASDTRDTGSTLQGSAGQIGLGTLLSSQINYLLNSNLSNLDIDLHLTGFDQADLGVALRLFDDRLTVRREGVVTGPDAGIGDFDIIYRINRYFSVEVFHRRDPLLPGIVAAGQNQFESVNGIGLEARVQFNTWGELGNNIWGAVRRTFTSRKEDEPESEITATH